MYNSINMHEKIHQNEKGFKFKDCKFYLDV